MIEFSVNNTEDGGIDCTFSFNVCRGVDKKLKVYIRRGPDNTFIVHMHPESKYDDNEFYLNGDGIETIVNNKVMLILENIFRNMDSYVFEELKNRLNNEIEELENV